MTLTAKPGRFQPQPQIPRHPERREQEMFPPLEAKLRRQRKAGPVWPQQQQPGPRGVVPMQPTRSRTARRPSPPEAGRSRRKLAADSPVAPPKRMRRSSRAPELPKDFEWQTRDAQEAKTPATRTPTRPAPEGDYGRREHRWQRSRCPDRRPGASRDAAAGRDLPRRAPGLRPVRPTAVTAPPGACRRPPRRGYGQGGVPDRRTGR